MHRSITWNSFILLLPLAGACNPTTTAVKIGMHVVGKVMSDESACVA